MRVYPWLLDKEEIPWPQATITDLNFWCPCTEGDRGLERGQGLVSTLEIRSETPMQLLQCEKYQEPDVEARQRQESLITEGKEENNSSQLCAMEGMQSDKAWERTAQPLIPEGSMQLLPGGITNLNKLAIPKIAYSSSNTSMFPPPCNNGPLPRTHLSSSLPSSSSTLL